MVLGDNLKMSAAELEYEKVRIDTKREFADFKIVYKSDSGLMKVIDYLLMVITLGCMRNFMGSYTTTIGNTVYVSDQWNDRDGWSKSTILRHERVHMRQRRRLGTIRFVVMYLFWPLPLVFALGRRNLEQEAYEETLRAYVEYFGSDVPRLGSVRTHIVNQFMGPSYFWMWPFRSSIERWYEDVLSKLKTENAQA